MQQPQPFVDYVKIYFKSGAGGSGVVSWRREALVSMGGPDGGDGGHGGSIILKGNPQLWTLLDLKYRKFFHAQSGENGGKQNKTGKTGKDEILEVPLGTVVKDADTGELLTEITKEGETYTLLRGGAGGKGNWQFRTATNQAPDYAKPGKPGKELTAIIELKILADVGLVGFPNAGKSTLLSVVSAAKPKIGAYPFTTLVPNLGLVRYRDNQSFVMADIPGIIEDAHKGKGLGTRFLRHIERNSVLLFLIPVDTDDIVGAYKILLHELESYDKDLLYTPRLVAITKCDMIDKELELEILEEIKELNPIFISSVAQQGLQELKDEIWKKLNEID